MSDWHCLKCWGATGEAQQALLQQAQVQQCYERPCCRPCKGWLISIKFIPKDTTLKKAA